MNAKLPLKIFTLGGLSIQRGDQPVNGFISRKVEALLVYLAFEQREHPRELLAELLWNDLTQARAMGNLRTALSSLQSQLSDYLIVTRQTVMIDPESRCWVDALELEAVFKTVETLSGELTPPLQQNLETALDLYHGDFLAGFHLRDAQGFEGWMLLEAERLRGKVIEMLQRLVREALDRGTYGAGIEQARRLLTLDSLWEETHRSLMLLLARSGQRSAALLQYETCVRLLREELDVAPEPETTRLFTQIQTEQITVAPATPAAPKPIVRLPLPATPFVERSAELGQIAERLKNPDCRLLTLVGPGGIGKTRLALQTAAEHAHEFRDGVFFVSLVSVDSGEFLPVEIANVIRCTLQGISHPREELLDYLATRELLLLLDNFEHLVNYADLISDILARARDVRILVTSREWLNLQGEWVLPIGGMDCPPANTLTTVNTEDIAHYSAVQLFTACAQRVRPRFNLDDEREAVIRICQLVEGMPLSIELAATWLRVISASEIAQQVNVNFLATNARNVPARHRSVRAVFDYSWKLLTADEQHVLMNLSVFKGPFDRAGAVQVAGASIPILASLVEKSLIRLVDKHYYGMHELLRQYAREHLLEVGKAVDAQNAHLDYYVRLTADPDSRIHGQLQTQWLDRLESEHENLSTAIAWALEHNTESVRAAGLNIGSSVWEFWLMRGRITEGRQWLDRLLAATEGTVNSARGSVTQGAGYLAWIQGDNDRAEALHREGAAIRRAIDDKAGLGGSLSNLGVIAWSRGDYQAAQDFYEQALAARRAANYKLGTASVLSNLALLFQDQGEYTTAIPYAEEAWALFKELDDLQGMMMVMHNLGAITHDQGNWERAKTIEEEALVLSRQLGDPRAIGAILQNLGQIVVALGDYPQAHRYLDEALDMVTQVGDKTHIALTKKNMARLALAEGRIDEAQALISECLAIFGEVINPFYKGQGFLVQGDIHRIRGDRTAAENAYRDGLAMYLKAHNQHSIGELLYRLAGITSDNGQFTQAVIVLSAADALARRIDVRYPDHGNYIDREMLRSKLSPADYEAARMSGAAMDLTALANYLNINVAESA